MTKLIFVFLFIVLSFPTDKIYAESSSSLSGLITVNKIEGVLGKIPEKIILFLKFSNNDRASYKQYLVQKRLAELKYVFETKQGDKIEETSSRYSTYLGGFTDFLVKNRMVDKKEGVLNMVDTHLAVLNSLSADQNLNPVFIMLLTHNINYLKIYKDQIKAIN